MERRNGIIVVGVDGTPAGKAAIEFAVREGVARGSAVEVITAWTWDGVHESLAGPATAHEARDEAERMQAAAVAEVLNTAPDTPMLSRRVVGGEAGRVLVDASRDAAYLVVGSAHKGLLKRALLGSVSEYCVRHATCPVVVIPQLERERIHAPLATASD